MKLRAKLTLLISSFILVLIVGLSALIITMINQNTKKEIAEYRELAYNTEKAELKSKVDIVYNMIETRIQASSSKDYIETMYGSRVKNVIQLATSIVEGYHKKFTAGKLSLQEAQQQALEDIKKLRYDNGSGYVWVNDTAYPYPNMIMHPTVPSLDGQELNSLKWNTALGKKANLFKSAVEITKREGSGFIDYNWPKPTPKGLSKMTPKISYVSLYKPWNWVLGTGVYVDDSKKDTMEDLKNSIRSMKYGENQSGYFWINNSELPTPKIIVHPIIPQWEGKVTDDPKFKLKTGNNVYLEFVNALKKSGTVAETAYQYEWDKPTKTGLIPSVPKLAYIRHYKPLDWVVGTGVYMDDVEEQIEKRKESIKEHTKKLISGVIIAALAFLIISIIATLYYANTISKPIVHLTQVADDISKGKNLNQDIPETTRKDEIGQLGQAIARLQTSVNITLKRLMKK